jgi:hypothetical protein
MLIENRKEERERKREGEVEARDETSLLLIIQYTCS